MMMIRSLVAAVLASLALGAFAAIDVNKATQAELEALPGVGQALATRIVGERSKAAYKSWDDLIGRVKGVGPASAGKLSKAGLTVASTPYAPDTSAQAPKAAKAPKPATPAK